MWMEGITEVMEMLFIVNHVYTILNIAFMYLTNGNHM